MKPERALPRGWITLGEALKNKDIEVIAEETPLGTAMYGCILKNKLPEITGVRVNVGNKKGKIHRLKKGAQPERGSGRKT